MKKSIAFLSLSPLAIPALVSACPFCKENIASSPGGMGGGLSMGFAITIFLLIGTMAGLVSLIAWLMIKEGKKSDERHLRQALSPKA